LLNAVTKLIRYRMFAALQFLQPRSFDNFRLCMCGLQGDITA